MATAAETKPLIDIGKNVASKVAIKIADRALGGIIPSWSEIGAAADSLFGTTAVAEGGGVAAGSGLSAGTGIGAGVGTALGGFASAAGAAAPMLIFAMVMSALNNPDPSLTLAAGKSTNLGDLDVSYEYEPGRADVLNELHAAFLGDGKWSAGGDVSKVGDINESYGYHHVKAKEPYFMVGSGQPYALPELAISSGRQMAQGRMGLPVEHEALPSARAAVPDELFGEYLINRSLPVVDSVQEMPANWDQMIDQARSSKYFHQDNTEASQTFSTPDIEKFTDTLDPRLREFFDMGLSTDQIYGSTWKNSVDYDPAIMQEVQTGGGDVIDDITAVDNTYKGIDFGAEDSDVNKSPLTAALASHKMRNTDSIPALINPNEADILKGLGGSGERDPVTGMIKFENTESTNDDQLAAWFNAGNAVEKPANYSAPAGNPSVSSDSGAPAASTGVAEQPGAFGDYDRPISSASERAPDASSERPAEPNRAATDADYAARAAEWGEIERPTAEGQYQPPTFTGRSTGVPNDGLNDEMAIINSTEKLPTVPWMKPPTTNGGSGLVPVDGVNELTFGAGQEEAQALVDYFKKNGQIPVGSKIDTQAGTTSGMFDNRPGYGQADIATYELIAGLPPEVFDSISQWLGIDPNDPDALEYMVNYLGTGVAQGGEVIYEDGVYKGLTDVTYAGSPLETGKVQLGSPNNKITIDLNDVLAGNIPSYNAYNLALSAGYDHNDMDLVTQAANELMAALPQLGKIKPDSADYNYLRSPFEAGVPGFNLQVKGDYDRQQSQGRAPNKPPIGPTSIQEVLSNMDQYRALARSGMTTPLTDGAGNILAPDGSNKIIGTIPGNLMDDWMFINNPNEWMKYIGVFPGSGTPGGPVSPPPPPPPPAGSGDVGGGGGNGNGGGGNNNGGGGNGNGNGNGNGSGNPANALDALLAAFPSGYDLSAITDAFDDPIIQRILSEQRSTADQTLQRARASGQLNNEGYNAAYGDLSGPTSAMAQSRLEEISSGLIGGYRQDIRDIIADAIDYASASPKNFSVDPYKQSIDALIADMNANYYGELMRAIGGPLFDPAQLISTGGMAQGPISSGPSGSGVF